MTPSRSMMPTLALLILFSFVKPALGQKVHLQNKQQLIAFCDRFMQAFKNGKYTEAFDSLKAYTVIEDYKLDTLAAKTTIQLNSLSSVYGKTVSAEQVSERLVKNSLVRLTYLLKFEKSFLKFRFILYNNGTEWTITNFTYNEEHDDLFDAGAK